MGKFGAANDHLPKPQENTSKTPRHTKINKKPLKVTYISNPVMVKAKNPTEFRAIVQELTGKDSDIGTYDDENTMDRIGKELDHVGAYVSDLYPQGVADYLDESYSASLHGRSVDEDFLWKELPEGLVMGFQSRCVPV